MDFQLISEFSPTGDQPQAIERLVDSINSNNKFQTLLGVTGSGKTFTMANIIKETRRPTLVIAHNKTLAAQLYSEFKEFFPDNRVEFFVSYYDYYQPEAYVVSTDTYIEKDSAINEEIDKLRHSATASILEREDVIIVASVSCIYGLGDPEEYKYMMVSLRPGMEKDRDEVIKSLVEIQYERNDMNFVRGTFRVKGDILEVLPANTDVKGLRIEFFGDEIERMYETSPANQLHIQRALSGNCFGDYQTRTGLDVRTRELLTFSMLVSLGGCEPQVKGHIRGNVNVGNDKDVLLAVVTQLLPYIGYPRTLNAIACLNEAIPENE